MAAVTVVVVDDQITFLHAAATVVEETPGFCVVGIGDGPGQVAGLGQLDEGLSLLAGRVRLEVVRPTRRCWRLSSAQIVPATAPSSPWCPLVAPQLGGKGRTCIEPLTASLQSGARSIRVSNGT